MKKHLRFPRRILLNSLVSFLVFLMLQHLCLSVHAAGQDQTPSDNIINLLLIGQDRRESESRARADTLILCTLSPDTGQITLTSFLRDLYVEIPGHEPNRINAAYALGGMPLLKSTFQHNFGITPHGCIEVDFSRFAQIIDTLGGVTLELRQDEAETINKTVPGSLAEGTQLLNGNQALAYSRIRTLDADGDFSRAARQRKLIFSLLDSYRNAGLLTILSAAADTLPLISTDLEDRKLLALAAKLFPLLDSPQVISQRIPQEGTYSYETVRNMDVLIADLEAIRGCLKNTQNNEAAYSP